MMVKTEKEIRSGDWGKSKVKYGENGIIVKTNTPTILVTLNSFYFLRIK